MDSFIEEKFFAFDNQLTTIVGIGTTLAASLLTETGDINRFDSPEKLAAFAGIDPSVKQSGEFNGTRCRMSERGSPYLRRTFWLAAVSGIRFNPALKAVYDKKRVQGKAHAVAVSVLKSNQPYKIICPIFFS